MNDLDPLLLRAYAQARAERPRSGAGKARTLAALGLTKPAPSPPKISAPRGWAWPWWTIGLALLATRGETFHPTASPPVAPTIAVSTSPPAIVTTPDAVSAPTISVDALPNVVMVNRPARASTACTSCKPIPPAGSPSPSLRDEIEAIGRASQALSQRRCSLAGRELADYRARFPHGRLERESEVMAIEIAGRSGQTERARVAARAFVERFPGSPYALRLGPWLRDEADDPAVVMCADRVE